MASPVRSAPSAVRAASARAMRRRPFCASRARKDFTKMRRARRPACRACPESTRTSETAAPASCARPTTLLRTPPVTNVGFARPGDPPSKEASSAARAARARFLSPLPIPICLPAPHARLGPSHKLETISAHNAPRDCTRPVQVRQHATRAVWAGGAHPLALASPRRAQTAVLVVTLLQKARQIRAPAMPVLQASRTMSLVQTAAMHAQIAHMEDHHCLV